MKYLLDTDHISFLQLPASPEYRNLAARMARHSLADFAFCVVSFHEQVIGAHSLITRAKNPAEILRGYNLLQEILRGFTVAPVLPFDASAILIFAQMQGRRLRVPTMDLRIASIAQCRNLIVLSRNTADFGKVPGLVVQDWTN